MPVSSLLLTYALPKLTSYLTTLACRSYCGLVSWLICCFVPFGCFIGLCPVDERLVQVA
jgi:hypothetical protein